MADRVESPSSVGFSCCGSEPERQGVGEAVQRPEAGIGAGRDVASEIFAAFGYEVDRDGRSEVDDQDIPSGIEGPCAHGGREPVRSERLGSRVTVLDRDRYAPVEAQEAAQPSSQQALHLAVGRPAGDGDRGVDGGIRVEHAGDESRVGPVGLQKVDYLPVFDDGQLGERVAYVDSKIHPCKISDSVRAAQARPCRARDTGGYCAAFSASSCSAAVASEIFFIFLTTTESLLLF